MPVYKKPEPIHFTQARPVEKHFHDHDETWIVTAGHCRAYMIDRDGGESEIIIEGGDIWMVEAGVEHGCDPLGEEGVHIFPFYGTVPDGSQPPGHYYMEKEGYMPTLILERQPIDRYSGGVPNA